MENKIQTGLRIPESRHNEIARIAQEAGVSVNTLALVLIELGLSVMHLGPQEVFRSLLRNQQDIS